MIHLLIKSYRRGVLAQSLIDAGKAKITELDAKVTDLQTQNEGLRSTIRRQDDTILNQDAKVCNHHPPLPHASPTPPHALQIFKLRDKVNTLRGQKRSLRVEAKRHKTNNGRMADSAVCEIGWNQTHRRWAGVVYDGRSISHPMSVVGVAVPPPAQ